MNLSADKKQPWQSITPLTMESEGFSLTVHVPASTLALRQILCDLRARRSQDLTEICAVCWCCRSQCWKICTKWQVSSATAQTDVGLMLFVNSSERTHIICPTFLRKSREKSCIAVHLK